jgi:hypothetical protein
MRLALIAALLLIPLIAVAGDSATAVVDRYVREHRHWKASDYRIRRDRTEDHYVVFLITYLPEQNRPRIGGGKTFEAYYDLAKHKVIKEMHFQ